MAQIKKLGKTTTLRMAIIKGQASDLFWYGRIETTLARGKSVKAYAEKLLTLAINTYEDNVKVVKEVKDEKGKVTKKEVVMDGIKKLNARRKLMSKLNDIQEQKQEKEKGAAFRARTKDIEHPLLEKIFNVYAPKYAKRAKELNQGGGYLRIIRKDIQKGNAAVKVIVEFV